MLQSSKNADLRSHIWLYCTILYTFPLLSSDKEPQQSAVTLLNFSILL